MLFLLLAFFILPVYAADSVSVANHWVGAFQEYDIAYVHPTPPGVADHSGTGQGFRPTIDGYYLTNVTVQMKKSGSPTGALFCRLVTLDAQSATAEVTETTLANSTTYIISSNLTTSYVNYTFQFDRTYQLNNSIYYGFIITGYNASFTLANKVQVNADRYSASNNYADGVSQYYNYGQWSKELQFALYFDVFANVDPYTPPVEPPGFWEAFNFPFSLLLLIVAVAMIFGGGFWFIKNVREREFMAAFNGFIIFIVGAAIVAATFMGG